MVSWLGSGGRESISDERRLKVDEVVIFLSQK